MKNYPMNILVLMLCTLVLAGCHKLQALTKIESDGSGELRIEVGFSAEEREGLEQQNNNAQDFCNTSQAVPGVTVTEERRDEETWCITTTQFSDFDELRNLYLQRAGIQVNRLEIDDGKLYYDVDIDTISDDSSFSALSEITWSVEVPGTPANHNADLVDEKTLIWKPAVKAEVVNFRAESDIPNRFKLPSCSAGFIGLAAILICLRRRDRRASPL